MLKRVLKCQLNLVQVVGNGVHQGHGSAGVGDGLLHVEHVLGRSAGAGLQLLREALVLKEIKK